MQLVNSFAESRDWRLMRLMKYPLHCKKNTSPLKGGSKKHRSNIRPVISKELRSLCRLLINLCLKGQDIDSEEPE